MLCTLWTTFVIKTNDNKQLSPGTTLYISVLKTWNSCNLLNYFNSMIIQIISESRAQKVLVDAQLYEATSFVTWYHMYVGRAAAILKSSRTSAAAVWYMYYTAEHALDKDRSFQLLYAPCRITQGAHHVGSALINPFSIQSSLGLWELRGAKSVEKGDDHNIGNKSSLGYILGYILRYIVGKGMSPKCNGRSCTTRAKHDDTDCWVLLHAFPGTTSFYLWRCQKNWEPFRVAWSVRRTPQRSLKSSKKRQINLVGLGCFIPSANAHKLTTVQMSCCANF